MPGFQPCSAHLNPLAQPLLFACGRVDRPFFPRAPIFIRRLYELGVQEQGAQVAVVFWRAVFVPVKDDQRWGVGSPSSITSTTQDDLANVAVAAVGAKAW
jgi:hypothetical protein